MNILKKLTNRNLPTTPEPCITSTPTETGTWILGGRPAAHLGRSQGASFFRAGANRTGPDPLRIAGGTR